MNISLGKTMEDWAAALCSCCYWKSKLTSGSLYAPCSGITIASWRDLEALNHCQMQQRSSTWRWGGRYLEELLDGISYLGSWEETGRLGDIQERYLEAGEISGYKASVAILHENLFSGCSRWILRPACNWWGEVGRQGCLGKMYGGLGNRGAKMEIKGSR